MTPQDSKIFRPWDKSEPNDDSVSLYNAWTSLILEPRRSCQTSATSVTSSSSPSSTTSSSGTTVTTLTSSNTSSSLESTVSSSCIVNSKVPPITFAPASPVMDAHHSILSAFPSAASASSFNAAVAAVTAAAASGHHSVGSLASFMSSTNVTAVKKQRPKRFHCPHCQIAFSNQGQLRGHVRIHTGERPFVCDHENCGKSFTRNEELTRHKR